jgi:phospho-N-acetylmuramoyl-pentapeptide-transferase
VRYRCFAVRWLELRCGSSGYNAHPAEIFISDVGSLSLGDTLGTIAVIIKREILLSLWAGFS